MSNLIIRAVDLRRSFVNEYFQVDHNQTTYQYTGRSTLNLYFSLMKQHVRGERELPSDCDRSSQRLAIMRGTNSALASQIPVCI